MPLGIAFPHRASEHGDRIVDRPESHERLADRRERSVRQLCRGDERRNQRRVAW